MADRTVAPAADIAERVRSAVDDTLTPSLDLSEWACDPPPSCPHYAHVNPDWLRALIAEARAVRAALSSTPVNSTEENADA